MPNEEWRVVAEDPRYEVSSLGRVRSWCPLGSKRGGRRGEAQPLDVRAPCPRLLRPGVASNGYPTIALGKGNTRCVHVLVAAAFLGPCPLRQEVRHWNGVRSDCRAENLLYGTRLDNIRDAQRHGTLRRCSKAAA